jgi:hypothetical protein
MNRLLLAFTAALPALVCFVSNANSAPSLPGEALGGSKAYVVSFNANGAGFYVTLIPARSIDLVRDQGIILDGFLAYQLPEAVVTGDVALESDKGAIGAGLRFLEENGTYLMIESCQRVFTALVHSQRRWKREPQAGVWQSNASPE